MLYAYLYKTVDIGGVGRVYYKEYFDKQKEKSMKYSLKRLKTWQVWLLKWTEQKLLQLYKSLQN